VLELFPRAVRALPVADGGISVDERAVLRKPIELFLKLGELLHVCTVADGNASVADVL
jgi:hypothetical protein